MAAPKPRPGKPRTHAAELRAALGLTQEQFAHMIHVSFTTVSRWENGRTAPRGMGGTLLALVERARVHVDDKTLLEALRPCESQADVVTVLARLTPEVGAPSEVRAD